MLAVFDNDSTILHVRRRDFLPAVKLRIRRRLICISGLLAGLATLRDVLKVSLLETLFCLHRHVRSAGELVAS